MKARVIRRGGEVAIVIPEGIAETRLREVSEVEIEVRGADVVITQLDMTLDEMIDQISNENRHDLIDFGPPVGKEVW